MKTKSKILSSVLAVLLIIPTILLLSACNSYLPEYAWGKSFSYQGVTIDDKESRGENSSTTTENLIKNEYIKGNLDLENATINEEIFDLTQYQDTTADNFVQNLDNIAKTKLNEMYKDLTISVGTEREKTIKLNGVLYNLEQTIFIQYDIVETSADGSKNVIGSVNPEISLNYYGKTKGCLQLCLSSSKFFKNGLYEIRIKIPTKTICDDATAEVCQTPDGTTYTAIYLTYTPFFSKTK